MDFTTYREAGYRPQHCPECGRRTPDGTEVQRGGLFWRFGTSYYRDDEAPICRHERARREEQAREDSGMMDDAR